jgi:hypothetical protein
MQTNSQAVINANLRADSNSNQCQTDHCRVGGDVTNLPRMSGLIYGDITSEDGERRRSTVLNLRPSVLERVYFAAQPAGRIVIRAHVGFPRI